MMTASQPETGPAWLTAAEAAAYLRVKPRSLLLWVRQGRVQAYALSGTRRRVWRFRREDLDRVLLDHPVLPVISSQSPTVLAERRV
jgi:excisionase family DNA binding protein